MCTHAGITSNHSWHVGNDCPCRSCCAQLKYLPLTWDRSVGVSMVGSADSSAADEAHSSSCTVGSDGSHSRPLLEAGGGRWSYSLGWDSGGYQSPSENVRISSIWNATTITSKDKLSRSVYRKGRNIKIDITQGPRYRPYRYNDVRNDDAAWQATFINIGWMRDRSLLRARSLL